jgi:uncharacterized membrane protein YhaH (DUF805 family)
MSAVAGAHVLGIPIEETIGPYGPVLLLVLSATSAGLAVRVRRLRDRGRSGMRREPPVQRTASGRAHAAGRTTFRWVDPSRCLQWSAPRGHHWSSRRRHRH